MLSGEEILRRSKKPGRGNQRLIHDIAEDNLKGGAYDLRMAFNGMVLPDGRIIGLGDKDRYESTLVVEPGQTILVSTRERLNVPRDLTGNISIKGELAGKGVLALTGLIVDPGYHLGGSGDGRLHFRLANLGSRPVLLEPGKTKIASIQFVQLDQPSGYGAGESFDNIWQRVDELRGGLGFLEELRSLDERVKGLELGAEQQERAVSLVVIAGIFVILATILGAAIAGILSLGKDSDIVDAAKNVIPNDTRGQLLLTLSLFGIAAIAGAIAWGVVGGRSTRRSGQMIEPQSVKFAVQEIVADLRAKRVRRLALSMCALGTLGMATLAAIVELSISPWVATAGAGLSLLGLLLWRGDEVWTPITPTVVNAEVRRWLEASSSPGATSDPDAH